MLQWMGVHLPIQGIKVQSLVWEDATRYKATRETTAMRSLCIAMKSSPCLSQLEKAQQGPSTAKNKQIINNY